MPKKSKVEELEIRIRELEKTESEYRKMIKQLQLNEERFRNLYEETPLGYQSLDLEGHFIEVNSAWLDLMAYSRSEVIGHWFGEFLAPSGVESYKKGFSKFIESGEVHTDVMMLKRDGSEIVVHIDGRIGKDEKGKSKQTHCILHDITERNQMEEVLRESEERLRQLFENMSSGVAVYEATEDGEDFVFKDFNRAAERIEQISRNEVMGKSVTDVFPRVFEFGLLDVLKKVWRSGVPEDHPISFYKDDRIEGWRENYVYKLPSGEIVSVYDDVTGRKRMEEAVEESEKRVKQNAEFDRALAAIGRIISSTLSIDEVYERFAAEVKKLIPLDRINIGLIDPESRVYRIEYATGIEIAERFKGQELPVPALVKETMQTKSGILLQPEREDDFAKDYPEFMIPFRAGIRSVIVEPLISGDEVIGVLYLASLSLKVYSERHLLIAEKVASQIAGAIANARLYYQVKKTEKALRESENRYRTIFEQNRSVIFIRDPETETFMDVNPAACSFYGYSRQEMIGMKLSQIAHGHSDRIAKRTEQTLNRGSNHFTTRHYLKSGESREVEVYNNTIMIGDKRAVLAIIHDITDRRKAEAALARRSEFERLVSKMSSDFAGMKAKEIDAGINRALASVGAVSGADRAYVFLLREAEKIADNAHEWCAENIQPQIKNLQNISINEEMPWFSEQIRKHDVFQVPDVSAMPVQASLEQQHFEAQGIKSLIVVPMRLGPQPVGFLGFAAVRDRKTWTDEDIYLLRLVGEIFTNVIERNRAEKALQKSEKKYKDLYDQAPVGYMEIDAKGLISNINRKELEMFGYTYEEILGRHLWDFVVEKEAQDSIKAKLSGIKPRGKGFERSFRRKDGSTFPVLIDDFIVKDDRGRIIGMRCINRDITDIKQAEIEKEKLEAKLRQAQKMESIGTLAGGIAHEFNNILGIIIGNTELAIEDVQEWNPAMDCLKEIREASLRAKDVVRQIMSLARKTPMDRKPIQIGTVIQKSLKLMHSTIPKSIEIQQEILCDSEAILANDTEISQILMNLCSNSVHAMKDETGTIEVRLEPVVLDDGSAFQYEDIGAGEYVKLSVTDTGEGIDRRILDRVFDPYFTTKDVGKGLGMGMAVVYGIVKKYDGAIRIMSEIGKGTRVEVLFPVTGVLAEEDIGKFEKLPGGKESILFVDDEPSLVKMARQMLERQGYRVVGMTSSKEALKLFQQESDRFDLIISDMAMPEMPGDLLIREVLKIRPNIPVILCSGHSERIDEKNAEKLGVSAYAMKPLKTSELVRIVRKVLDET